MSSFEALEFKIQANEKQEHERIEESRKYLEEYNCLKDRVFIKL